MRLWRFSWGASRRALPRNHARGIHWADAQVCRAYRGVPTSADSTSTDNTLTTIPSCAPGGSRFGRYNGAWWPWTEHGRILTVVNQKIAFGEGYIPCSTSSRPLHSPLLKRTSLPATRCSKGPPEVMNLTEAMAHSNNTFFEQLGTRMGFDTVSKYSRFSVLGELAGSTA